MFENTSTTKLSSSSAEKWELYMQDIKESPRAKGRWCIHSMRPNELRNSSTSDSNTAQEFNLAGNLDSLEVFLAGMIKIRLIFLSASVINVTLLKIMSKWP